MEKTDEEIAKLVQEGDLNAFGFLVERYEEKLKRYARKFLVERDDILDLVQEVFIKAYTNIKSFKIDKKFSPWIYRIAHNEFVNALKKKKYERLHFIDSDTVFPHPIAKEGADDLSRERENKEFLDKGLNSLEVKYREPLILFYFEEMSYKEIADVLQIPVSTVGVRITRGKGLIKKTFSKINSELYE